MKTLQEQIIHKRKELRVLEEKVSGWLPEDGETYHLISTSKDNGVSYYTWNDDEQDNNFRLHFGVYKTEKEALKVLAKLKKAL